jgi:hypothetical protein
MTFAVKNRPSVVVPQVALRRAGFTSGEELEVKASDGVFTILAKLPAANDEYTPAARRAIDRGIAASEKDYEKGRSYGPFKTHEALVASLHAEAAKLRKKNTTPASSAACTRGIRECKQVRHSLTPRSKKSSSNMAVSARGSALAAQSLPS